MLELYGRQWEVSCGHVDGAVFPTWCEALTELSPQTIKGGLDLLKAEGSDYPPNLVKFLRLCRESKTTPIYHPQLNRPKPHYSVMAIERAKQRALMGYDFKPSKEGNRLIMDWTIDDEKDLCDLIASWDKSTGYDGLNRLIDNYQFSQGTHYSKTRERQND